MKNIKITYSCRDEEVRATISKDEAVRRITKYGGEYDPTTQSFDVYDQLLACESIAESSPVRKAEQNTQEEREEKNVYVNGRFDSSRQTINFELNQNKLDILSQLKRCTYRSDPRTIAELLNSYFDGCGSNPDWWLRVSQRWPPRPIYRVIDRLIKLQTSGRMTIRNPAKYFTFLIKKRRKRRFKKETEGGEHGN